MCDRAHLGHSTLDTRPSELTRGIGLSDGPIGLRRRRRLRSAALFRGALFKTSLVVLCTLHAALYTLHSVRAAVSSGDGTELNVADFSQAGRQTSSENFRQQVTIGGGPATGVMKTSAFVFTPGFLGAAFGRGSQGVLFPDELDITVLYARTMPMGAEISPQRWQTDGDPIFIWEPPAAGLDLAGYSYALDEPLDDTVDTSASSFDVAVEMSELLSDGTHTFAVKAINTAGIAGEPISFALWVDTTPPSMTSYSPAPGSLLNTSTPSITATVADEHSGVTVDTIELLINGSSVPILYTLPTSTMSSNWAGAFREGANSLELRASDLLGNEQAPLVWSVTIDTVPPTGMVVINAGADMTTSIYVTLELAASDGTSGVAGMLLSNDALTGYVQEAYAAARALWALESVSGTRRVYAKFIDAAGNESEPVFDEIDLVLMAPETVITNGPAGFLAVPGATFTFMCPNGGCVFSYAFDNDTWSGWASTAQASVSGLSAGNHYFRVKAAREVNGVEGIQPEEEDPSPAERTWIISIEPPSIMIPFGPPIKLWRLE